MHLKCFVVSYDAFLEKAQLDPLLSGGLAGMSAWSIALPIDIVKTRIQNSSIAGHGFAWHLMNIIKKEGPLALY